MIKGGHFCVMRLCFFVIFCYLFPAITQQEKQANDGPKNESITPLESHIEGGRNEDSYGEKISNPDRSNRTGDTILWSRTSVSTYATQTFEQGNYQDLSVAALNKTTPAISRETPGGRGSVEEPFSVGEGGELSGVVEEGNTSEKMKKYTDVELNWYHSSHEVKGTLSKGGSTLNASTGFPVSSEDFGSEQLPSENPDEGRADYVYTESRSDIPVSPIETPVNVIDTELQNTNVTTISSIQNYTGSLPSVPHAVTSSKNTMSWLDSFMYQHRGSLWILFNTFFMVIWILVGILALYRLLGLPWCSPFLSRTQYLIVHLLIFTAATFEFVQLIHLSYGSHEGLPLFLTLLLTHTPTPCLAVGLIIMTHCVFTAARASAFGVYLPPLIYIGILGSFVIVLSFVGDIIVGVSRNCEFLIIVRVTLVGLCLVWLLAFIFNYRKIARVAVIMRNEFRSELKSLAVPVESNEDSQDTKHHLKKVLLTWSLITLVCSVFGVLMCVFSFCLSLFFTVSFVPLWAFWALHSAIFVSQVTVVICLTFGAAFTLTYSSRRNIFYKYFFPSFLSDSPAVGSFIKRGNFIYQRVSIANGPIISPVLPTVITEADERSPLRNNNIITELPTPPYGTKANLRRSATFNCAPPYGYPGAFQPTCSSNLYPVLSDHILPYSGTRLSPEFQKSDINSIPFAEAYHKPTLQQSNSFNHSVPSRREYPRYSYGLRHPMRSFHSQNHTDKEMYRGSFGSQSPPAAGSIETTPVICPELAGTVEALEISYRPMNVAKTTEHEIPSNRGGHLRQIPHYHSFSVADRRRARLEPPEKPARKTEPILVKSIIKDNVYLENVVTQQETPESYTNYYLNKDPNVFSSRDSSPSYSGWSPYASTSTHTSPEAVTTQSQVPICSSSFNFYTPPSDPKCSSYSAKDPIRPMYFKTSLRPMGIAPPAPPIKEVSCSLSTETPKPSLFTPKSEIILPKSSTNISEIHTNIFKTSDEKSSHILNESKNESVSNLHKHISDSYTDSFAEKQNEKTDNTTFANSLTSTEAEVNACFDAATLPTTKTCSLKRNHSTAGDFSTPSSASQANKGENNLVIEDGLNPPNGDSLKYPWYGTWGGRRRSKKRDSISDSGSVNLKRLSASKSSLSSLYEKLKPKRSRITLHHPKEEELKTQDGGDKEEENVVELKFAPEEEEEEFLPRLDEDIDLASEILKSSSVLADFYSLKRSDLKKRKNDKNRDEDAPNIDDTAKETVNGVDEAKRTINGMDEENNETKNNEGKQTIKGTSILEIVEAPDRKTTSSDFLNKILEVKTE